MRLLSIVSAVLLTASLVLAQGNPLDPPPANPLGAPPPAQPVIPAQPAPQSPAPQQPAIDPMSDWTANVQPGLIGLLAPDLQRLGAPEWCKPGVRITYYSAAATVSQGGYQLIEDPTGNWEDPKTGRRYRKTDERPMPGDNGGGSGDGFSQIDIVSVGRNAVAVNNLLFTINRASNNDLTQASTTGAIQHAAAASDTWIHPAALRQVMQANRDGLLILRGQVPFDGRNVDALCIVNRQGGAYASYTYDANTGLLLINATATPSTPAPIAAEGHGMPGGRVQLTYTRFLGMRQVKIRSGGALPEFIKNARAFRYAGICNWTHPADPSYGSFNYPMELAVQLESHGPNWVLAKLGSLINMGGVPQPSESTLMAGAFSDLWVNPELLRQMRPQMVLDEDPFTKIRITCAAIDARQATIVTQGPGIFTQASFDMGTGQLVAGTTKVPSSGMTYQVQLQNR